MTSEDYFEEDYGSWGFIQEYGKSWTYNGPLSSGAGLVSEYLQEDYYHGLNEGQGNYLLYNYNMMDRLISVEAGDWDIFSGPTSYYQDEEISYTYDIAGNIETEENDTNLDGTAEFTHTYTYDGQGRMLTDTYIDSNDSSNDYIYAWTYDLNGYVLTYSESNGSGTLESQETYYYQCN